MKQRYKKIKAGEPVLPFRPDSLRMVESLATDMLDTLGCDLLHGSVRPKAAGLSIVDAEIERSSVERA